MRYLFFFITFFNGVLYSQPDTTFIIVNPNVCNPYLLRASYIDSVTSRNNKKVVVYFKDTRKRSLTSAFEQYFRQSVPNTFQLEVYDRFAQHHFSCGRNLCIYDTRFPDLGFNDFEEYIFNDRVFVPEVGVVADTFFLDEMGKDLGRPNFVFTPMGGYFLLNSLGAYVLYDSLFKPITSGNYLDSLLGLLKIDRIKKNLIIDPSNFSLGELFKMGFRIIKSNGSSLVVLATFDLIKTMEIEAAPPEYSVNILMYIDSANGNIKDAYLVQGQTSEFMFKLINAYYDERDSSLLAIPTSKSRSLTENEQIAIPIIANIRKDEYEVFRFRSWSENYLTEGYYDILHAHGLLMLHFFNFQDEVYFFDRMNHLLYKNNASEYKWEIESLSELKPNTYRDLFETGYFNSYITDIHELNDLVVILVEERRGVDHELTSRKLLKIDPVKREVKYRGNLPDLIKKDNITRFISRIRDGVIYNVVIDDKNDSILMIREKILE